MALVGGKLAGINRRSPRTDLRRSSPRRSLVSAALIVIGLVLVPLGLRTGTPLPLLGILLLGVGVTLRLSFARVSVYLAPCVAYVGLWVAFGILRSYADETPWTDSTIHWVPEAERTLFGQLPSEFLQRNLYTPGVLHWYDYGLTAVYYSFFILPMLIAALMIVRNRAAFWFNFVTLFLMETGSLILHFVIPTSPPWIFDPHLVKITHIAGPVMGFSSTVTSAPGSAMTTVDSNPLAAMPSVHMGVTCALAIAAWRFGGRWFRIASVAYCLAMALCLVYFSEHYVLDELVGVALALAGGIGAKKLLASEGVTSISLPGMLKR